MVCYGFLCYVIVDEDVVLIGYVYLKDIFWVFEGLDVEVKMVEFILVKCIYYMVLV